MQQPRNQHPAYIECPNCGAIELTNQPLDYQESLHETPYQLAEDGSIRPQIIGVFGGYGSGKSRASLQEFFLRCLENNNGTGLVLAPTLQQLKRTTLKTIFNEIIPPPLIENYNKSEGMITLVNGFTIYTIPADDDEKIRSINAGLIHMEESSAINRTIYDQLLTRMRDPFVKVKTMFVCSNPELTWIKDVIVDNDTRKDPKHPEHEDYNPYITCHIWATKLNKLLPPDFIQMNAKGKPSWWIRKYLEGSFEAIEGAVYPRFIECFVDPYPVISGRTDEYGIPMDWERFVTLDHGLRNATAVYFHAIDPKKAEVVTYLEYYKPNTLVPEHAKTLKPLIDKIPRGRLRFMVADPSIRNKTDPVNGKSVQSLYQEYDLFFTPGNNSIETGILRVNSYIERGKWRIYRTCVNLMKEGLHYKFPELDMDSADENLDEKPIKANDHAMDSIRYGFMRLPDDPDLLLLPSYEPRKLNQVEKKEYGNGWGWTDEMQDKYSDHEGDWTSYGY
jgi:PBSX family phage terminase large subunit